MSGIPDKGENMKRRERLSTGILKLDEYLRGGIPEGTWCFITGEPGTGKTILCLHITYTNPKDGLNVIYVTTEQPFTDLVEQAKQFNMDLTAFTRRNRSLFIIGIFDLYECTYEKRG